MSAGSRRSRAPKITTAHGQGVVGRVAQQLLGLAGQAACDLGRRGEVVVLLGTQPAEHVAEVHAAPPLVLGRIRASAMDGGAEIDHGRAGRHLGVDHFGFLGGAFEFPLVAAWDQAGRPIFTGEVHERHGRGYAAR